MCGDRFRAGIHFLTISVTFSIGIALHSTVIWPTWAIGSEQFNLINNFTFLTQLGTGLPAIASFIAASDDAGGGALGALTGRMSHSNFELGSYYLVVAGALNYFAVGNFYDRHVHVHPRFQAPQDDKEQSQS